MSNQTAANGTDFYFLSSTGVDKVSFNKLSSPPFAYLNKGILYELDDGVLYFNGQAISNDAGGDVAGPVSSNTDGIALYADGTGKVIKNSNVIVQDTTVDSTDPGVYCSLFSDPSVLFQPWGYNSFNGISIGCGSSLPYAQFIDGTKNSNCIFLGTNCGQSINGASDSSNNVIIGDIACPYMQNGGGNVIIGTGAGEYIETPSTCVYIGLDAAQHCLTGTDNIVVGASAASAWTGSESGNITIGNSGFTGDNNIIRIGDSQTDTYLTGNVNLVNGNINFETSGNKIITTIASGATAGAASFGTCTLISGTLLVSTSAVTASSQIVLSRTTVGSSTALGMLVPSSRVAGTSFTIVAANPASPGSTLTTDLSTVFWMIIN